MLRHQYISGVRDKCHSLEHPLITNGDARNVVRAVRLDRVYDQVALARVRRPPVGRDGIVAQVYGKIHFRLLNRLELRKISAGAEMVWDQPYHQGRLVTISAVQTDALANERC